VIIASGEALISGFSPGKAPASFCQSVFSTLWSPNGLPDAPSQMEA